MSSIQDLFNVSDQLSKNLEIPHKLAVPKLTKIVVNAGIGKIKEDNKAIEKMKKDLSLITGQAPVVRLSKKAIASFKIRKGMPVGLSVTLRKNIMMEANAQMDINAQNINVEARCMMKITGKSFLTISAPNGMEILSNIIRGVSCASGRSASFLDS